MVAYGPPAKYGEYELLDGAIWGEIYYFYREHTGDPYSDKMAAKWSVTDAVYRVIYVYVDGSNCGNLYEYGDMLGDSGLHAPLKKGCLLYTSFYSKDLVRRIVGFGCSIKPLLFGFPGYWPNK